MAWTEPAIEYLRKRCADGVPFSKIAGEIWDEYHIAVSRSAVIGKASRLGFRQAKEKKPEPRTPRAPRSGKPPVDFRTRGNVALALDCATKPGVVENVIRIDQRCTLLELTEATCRWPLGDPGTPGFAFCGGPSMEGKSYCHRHCRIAYEPPSQRRDIRPIWK